MKRKPSLKDYQRQVTELTEALQRERADAENIRRRADEDKQKLGEFYKAMIVSELLPPLDNLERALKHIPDHKSDISRVAPWEKGIEGVIRQFEDCFAKLGVERIKTVGEVFDPRLHEAVHMDEGDGAVDSSAEASAKVEVVCEELTSGYKIGDEIIRHARVKVRMESARKKEA